MERFAVLCDAFLDSLKDIDGLNEADQDYLYTETKRNLTHVLQTAIGLSRLETIETSHVAASAITQAKASKDVSIATAVLGKVPVRPTSAAAPPLALNKVRQLEDLIGYKLLQHHGDAKAAFLGFDVDGVGHLSPADFKRAVNAAGIHLTDAEVRALVDRYDTEGDGMLNYVDFVNLVTSDGRDVWQSEMHSQFAGLSAGHTAVTPAEAGSKLSDTRRAQLHAGQIRSKLRSHSESATALYLAFKLHSKSGPLSFAQLRAGLERFGLDVATTTLQQALAPYTLADPGRSITIEELQHFLDNDIVADTSISGAAVVPDVFLRIRDAVYGDVDSLHMALKRFDAKHTGFISFEVLQSVLKLKGVPVTLAECAQLAEFLRSEDSHAIPHKQLTDALAITGEQLLAAAPAALASRPYEGGAAVKAPPAPKASTVTMDTDFIRRTHSDTRSLAKSILTDLYSTKHHEPPSLHASPSPAAAGKHTNVQVAPAGGRAPKAVVPLNRRVADALEGPPPHATYKRWASSSAGITQEDLIHGLKAIGCPISSIEARSLMKQFDEDADGKLSLHEFVKMWSK